MRLLFISLFTFSSFSLISQMTNELFANFSNLALKIDGDCMNSNTRFEVSVESGFFGPGTHYLYLTDCNNNILYVSDPIMFNLFNTPVIFSVGGIPECSPFKLFASELYSDTVFTGGIADQVGLLEFDPRIHDSDCPGPLSTASIPTLSQWGIIGLSTIMLIFGVVGIRQRKLIFG